MPPRIFLICYEFTFGTFSGNGILARSLVLSLLQQRCHVTVWCCLPPPADCESSKGNSKDHPIQVPEVSPEESQRLRVLCTTISTRQKWHRLDDECAWSEFIWDSLPEADRSEILNAAKEASAVLVIDWTGHHAWKSVPPDSPIPTPLVYLNFRVFSSGVKDAQKRLWYDAKERDAVHKADLVVALSQKDKASLTSMADTTSEEKIHILVPPLRKDVEDLAIQHMKSDQPLSIFWTHMPEEARKALTKADGTSTPRKCFVTCVVRLSPEKNTRRFVRFLQVAKSFLKERNWIPLLAGSASDPEYGRQLKTELRRFYSVNECVIVDSFLPPESLAAVFSCTVLNFHPCVYDAYGMTIMEAAALGVPSIIEAGNNVGASVHVGGGGSIEVEMKDKDHHDDHMAGVAIGKVLEKLQDTSELEMIGVEARKRALAWDETAYGKALLQHLAALSPRE